MSEPLTPEERTELFRLAEASLALACEALSAVDAGVFSSILRALPPFDPTMGGLAVAALASRRWSALFSAYDAMHATTTLTVGQAQDRLLAARETTLCAGNIQRAVEHLAEGHAVNMASVRSNHDQAVRYVAALAPTKTLFKIRSDQVWLVVGPQGKTIAGIVEKTGTTIDVEDDGTVAVASSDPEAVEKAITIIKGLTAEAGTPCPA